MKNKKLNPKKKEWVQEIATIEVDKNEYFFFTKGTWQNLPSQT
jgi:hypothetical protein